MSTSSLPSSPPPDPKTIGGNPARVLAVHVVEDHNEALPYIYRAIAAKRLPFSESLLLHFDAHPDLLSPEIQADNVTNKDLLFGNLSIADWILPAVYMGHIGRMVWVKPPWANQIPDGSYHLCVGKDRHNGHIRTSSPLTYFISELLTVERDELQNPTTITLDVVTLSPYPVPCAGGRPCSHRDQPEDPLLLPQTGLLQGQIGSPKAKACVSLSHEKLGISVWPEADSSMAPAQPPPAKRPRPSLAAPRQECSPLALGCCHQEAPHQGCCWQVPLQECGLKSPSGREVSHRHPTLQDGSRQEGCQDVSLYNSCYRQSTHHHGCRFSAELLNAISNARAWILDVDLDFFSTGNPYQSAYSEEQYELLRRLYQLTLPTGSDEDATRMCVEGRRRQLECLERMWAETPVARETKTELDLSPHDETLIGEMKALLGSIHNDSFINAEYLHISGMVTDLPVHYSSQKEIAGLVSAVTTNLNGISKTPSLVTISRSTEDEYTPSEEVDTIQQLVLDMLHNLYGNEMPESHDTGKASRGLQEDDSSRTLGHKSRDGNGMSCDTRSHDSEDNGAIANLHHRSHGPHHTSCDRSCDARNFLQLQVHLHYNTKQSTPPSDLDEPPRDICDCTYL